jgi:toxin YoeB
MPDGCLPRCGGLRDERVNLSLSKSCAGRWALARTAEREAIFHAEFRQDLRHWINTDRKVALRIVELIEAVMREPFTGIGKPEPLKYVLAGCWSRRVTQEHRLVYRVSEGRIDFLQARYHY